MAGGYNPLGAFNGNGVNRNGQRWGWGRSPGPGREEQRAQLCCDTETDNSQLEGFRNSPDSSPTDPIKCHYGHCLVSRGFSEINLV